MDLEDRGRPDLAHRCLNGYVEATGDYGLLVPLPFYLTYRAMVRAKVSTDAQTNLYLSHGRLSIDAECIGLGARTYKNHCALVLSSNSAGAKRPVVTGGGTRPAGVWQLSR